MDDGIVAAESDLDARRRELKHRLAAAETSGDVETVEQLRADLAANAADKERLMRGDVQAAAARRAAAQSGDLDAARKTPPKGRGAAPKATTAGTPGENEPAADGKAAESSSPAAGK